jgi:ABC-2 type transport system permease protein
MTISRIFFVSGRVLSQIKHDRRQLALSIFFPMIIIYFIKVLFDTLANPFFDASIYVVPYGAFIVHFITFILTAIVLVRERTSGTLERMFISGYNQISIIVGYLLAYAVITTIQSLLVLLQLTWLFELGYSLSQFASVYLIMWLIAIISLAIGILASNFARNEGQVFPFIPLVLVSFILSGIIIPSDKLPFWSQILGYLTPLYYGNNVLQNLILGGTLNDDWLNLIGLPIYGLVVMFFAMLTLREKN